MMSAATVGMLVRTVFSVLGCSMVALLVYTISIDGLPFRMDILTRWMAALLIDFYINIAVIGSWVVYKESSWIMAAVWVVLLIGLGSDVPERKGLSVVAARVVYSVLGCLMLGTLLYTLIVDGSPFRPELYTPWVVTTLIDFYINVVALSHYYMCIHRAAAVPSLT
ncbi:C4-dicarboxylate transport 1 [Tanacetum coccineum]